MNPPAAAVRRSPHFRSGWCRGHGRKDATPPPAGAANRLGIGIDTTINRLSQYLQKSDELLKGLR
jgi:hypothetical protein